MHHLFRLFFLLSIALISVACSTTVVESRSAFSKRDLKSLVPVSISAFDQAWAKPNYRWRDILEVYVAPVSTESLVVAEGSDGTQIQEEAQKLGKFLQEALVDSLATDSEKRFILVEEPDAGTVSIELAITALQPANPLASSTGYALGSLGGFFSQPLWSLSAAAFKGHLRGLTRVEGQFRDGGGKQEVFFRFADEETGRPALFSIRDLQRYAHARFRLKKWAEQCVQVLKSPYTPLRDPLPVTLNPF